MHSANTFLAFLCLFSSSLFVAGCNNHSSSSQSGLDQTNERNQFAGVVRKAATAAELCHKAAARAADIAVLNDIMAELDQEAAEAPLDLEKIASQTTCAKLASFLRTIAAIRQHQQDNDTEQLLDGLEQLDTYFEKERAKEVVRLLVEAGKTRNKATLQKAYQAAYQASTSVRAVVDAAKEAKEKLRGLANDVADSNEVWGEVPTVLQSNGLDIDARALGTLQKLFLVSIVLQAELAAYPNEEVIVLTTPPDEAAAPSVMAFKILQDIVVKAAFYAMKYHLKDAFWMEKSAAARTAHKIGIAARQIESRAAALHRKAETEVTIEATVANLQAEVKAAAEEEKARIIATLFKAVALAGSKEPSFKTDQACAAATAFKTTFQGGAEMAATFQTTFAEAAALDKAKQKFKYWTTVERFEEKLAELFSIACDMAELAKI